MDAFLMIRGARKIVDVRAAVTPGESVVIVTDSTMVEVSRPGESHPQALAEPYLNVSAHTAPIIQPPDAPLVHASGRTSEAHDGQCHPANVKDS